MNYNPINNLADLERVVAIIEQNLFIALDIEYHDYYSYKGLVCLIQISTLTSDYLIDSLAVDIRPLKTILESPSILKIVHDASLERSALYRLYDIKLCNVFDTVVAARALLYPRLGLADLAANLLGDCLDKSLQRADWRQRPLPGDMIEYAVKDTKCLVKIYLAMQIGSLGDFMLILEKSNFECAKEDSPNAAWKRVAKKSKWGLSEPQRRLIQTICGWRDTVAQEEDVSVHAIISDWNLLNIATAKHPVREAKHVPLGRFMTEKRAASLVRTLLHQASNSDTSRTKASDAA